MSTVWEIYRIYTPIRSRTTSTKTFRGKTAGKPSGNRACGKHSESPQALLKKTLAGGQVVARSEHHHTRTQDLCIQCMVALLTRRLLWNHPKELLPQQRSPRKRRSDSQALVRSLVALAPRDTERRTRRSYPKANKHMGGATHKCRTPRQAVGLGGSMYSWSRKDLLRTLHGSILVFKEEDRRLRHHLLEAGMVLGMALNFLWAHHRGQSILHICRTSNRHLCKTSDKHPCKTYDRHLRRTSDKHPCKTSDKHRHRTYDKHRCKIYNKDPCRISNKHPCRTHNKHLCRTSLVLAAFHREAGCRIQMFRPQFDPWMRRIIHQGPWFGLLTALCHQG